MRYGLRLRILVLATSTPVLLGQAALWLVDRSVQENVRSTTDDNLRRSALVCENILGSRTHTLQSSARAISHDSRFLAALTIPASPGDPKYRAIVKEAAGDLNRIAEADLFEVLDSKGRVIASAGGAASDDKSRAQLFARMGAGGSSIDFVKGVKTGLYLVAARTVTSGDNNIGFLLIGERIDDELKTLTRCEVTFLAAGKVLATTLPPGDDQSEVTKKLETQYSSDADLSRGAISEIKGGAESYLTLARTVPGSGPKTPAIFVIQRSLDEDPAFLFGIHARLNQLGAVIVLAGVVLGQMLSRKIIGPLLQLVRSAEEMEKGNYEYPIDVRTKDEIGYLADRFRDIREHQRAYVSSLEEAARLKSEFLSVASHELRTPVSIIKAYGELLSSGRLGSMNSEQKKALGVIDTQLDGIERIVEDAAWLSQLQGERPTLNVDEHEVRELIKAAVEEASADAQGRKHRFTTEIEPAVGQLRVDGPRFVHALANLVRNAIRFTPDGGRVSMRARRENGEVLIEVQDSGIGIAEDKKQHLFDRSFMFRSSLEHHSSRTLEFNSAGLGLGLPLARGIVEAHGGTIQVASEIGRGSTFTIRIPADQPAEVLATTAA